LKCSNGKDFNKGSASWQGKIFVCIHLKLLAFGARFEKDFGLRKFVSLILDLIEGTIFRVPISIHRRIWTTHDRILPRIICAIIYFIHRKENSVNPITDFLQKKCVWPNV
jgi:hypothetical protein